MSESSYYAEGDIKITSKRFVVGGKTFYLANISSATIKQCKEGPQLPGTAFAVIGGALLLCGSAGLVAGTPFYASLLLGVLGLIFGGVGVAKLAGWLDSTYWALIVTTAGQDVQAIQSQDAASLKSILAALNAAIADA